MKTYDRTKSALHFDPKHPLPVALVRKLLKARIAESEGEGPTKGARRTPSKRPPDKDHVFFEYQPKHTSDAVCAMFKGFKGFIQADAHCVYDALFRGEAVGDDEKPPDEVAYWSHARRHLW